MDLSDGFPESSRARLLPECGAELPPNPVVRTPTAGLLIDLGLDPPSVTVIIIFFSTVGLFQGGVWSGGAVYQRQTIG